VSLLPHSQDSATGLYPVRHESDPRPQTIFLEIHFNIIFPSTSNSSKWPFTFKYYDQNVVSILRLPSVGIALGYGLDDRGSRVRFPAGAGNFSLHHRVQNGSGAHPASYPMGTRGSFPGGKADGA
jgi:hypothetical protein